MAYLILENETGTTTSNPFRINLGAKNSRDADLPYLGVYGTIGTAIIKLQWKAADGNYYDTGDLINKLGLSRLPFSSETVLRLSLTAGGGSSISAEVINGIPI